MNDSDLFRQKDPTGYEVALSKQQYEQHIKERHPEIEPEHIQRVIKEPQYIYKGNHPDTREYFGESARYLKYMTQVSVATYEDSGDVRTAYTVKTIGKNVVPAEEGGLLYVGVSNKL